MNVMVIGGGKVGEYLTENLIGFGHRVKLIESNRENYRQLQASLPKMLSFWEMAQIPRFWKPMASVI